MGGFVVGTGARRASDGHEWSDVERLAQDVQATRPKVLLDTTRTCVIAVSCAITRERPCAWGPYRRWTVAAEDDRRRQRIPACQADPADRQSAAPIHAVMSEPPWLRSHRRLQLRTEVGPVLVHRSVLACIQHPTTMGGVDDSDNEPRCRHAIPSFLIRLLGQDLPEYILVRQSLLYIYTREPNSRICVPRCVTAGDRFGRALSCGRLGSVAAHHR